MFPRGRIPASWFAVLLLAATLLPASLAALQGRREDVRALERRVQEQGHALEVRRGALEDLRTRVAEALAERRRLEAELRDREARIEARRAEGRSVEARRAAADRRAREAAAEAAAETSDLP